MEKIKEIVTCVCLAAIAVSLMDTISHGKKLKKQLHLLFSGLIIVTILSAIVNSDISLDLPVYSELSDVIEKSEVIDVIDSISEREIEAELSLTLSDYLLSKGIIADKISVDVNIIDTDCIEISKTEVVLHDQTTINEVENAVKSLFGEIKVQIKIDGERI